MGQKRVTTLVVTASLAALIVALPIESSARQKKIVLNGCTMDQVKSNFGQSCVNQASDDLVKGHSYYHTLICNGDEMQCCTKDSKTGAILTCRKPPFSRTAPGMQGSSASGSVLSRGVEGDGVAEDAPPPSWMTEAWLKEHLGEKEVE